MVWGQDNQNIWKDHAFQTYMGYKLINNLKSWPNHKEVNELLAPSLGNYTLFTFMLLVHHGGNYFCKTYVHFRE